MQLNIPSSAASYNLPKEDCHDREEDNQSIGRSIQSCLPASSRTYAYADTEVKRNAISKASEDIVNGFPSRAKHEAYDENAILISMGLKD